MSNMSISLEFPRNHAAIHNFNLELVQHFPRDNTHPFVCLSAVERKKDDEEAILCSADIFMDVEVAERLRDELIAALPQRPVTPVGVAPTTEAVA